MDLLEQMPTALVLFLASLAPAALFLAAVFRAELPRAGTLEWITAGRRPRPEGFAPRDFNGEDLLWMLIPPAAALVLWWAYCFTGYLRSYALPWQAAALLAADNAPNAALLLMLSALCGYFLFRAVTGRRLAAVFGALTLTFGFIWAEDAVPLLLLSLLCFRMWAAQEPGSLFGALLFPFITAPYCAALYFEPRLAPGFLLLLGSIAAVYAGRIRREESSVLRAVGATLTALLCGVLTLALVLLLPALSEGMTLTELFTTDALPRYALLWLTELPYGLLPLTDWIRSLVRFDFIGILLMLLSVPALLFEWFRRRDLTALWLLSWDAALLALLFFASADFTPLASALLCAYFCARFQERGLPMYAVLCGVSCVFSSAYTTFSLLF